MSFEEIKCFRRKRIKKKKKTTDVAQKSKARSVAFKNQLFIFRNISGSQIPTTLIPPLPAPQPFTTCPTASQARGMTLLGSGVAAQVRAPPPAPQGAGGQSPLAAATIPAGAGEVLARRGRGGDAGSAGVGRRGSRRGAGARRGRERRGRAGAGPVLLPRVAG